MSNAKLRHEGYKKYSGMESSPTQVGQHESATLLLIKLYLY